MKSEAIIRQYIKKTQGFTWATDVAEHTIWGFKNAPFKNFHRAIAKVKRIVGEMSREGLVEIEPYEGYQDQIYNTGDK